MLLLTSLSISIEGTVCTVAPLSTSHAGSCSMVLTLWVPSASLSLPILRRCGGKSQRHAPCKGRQKRSDGKQRALSACQKSVVTHGPTTDITHGRSHI